MEKVRVDKWLWAVRIFKSRTLAADAVKEGKVKINGLPLKPAYAVSPGEVLTVRRESIDFQFKVLSLIEKRVGAPIAVTCYENLTPEEELKKHDAWYLAQQGAVFRERGAGRPTKKERREMEDFTGE